MLCESFCLSPKRLLMRSRSAREYDPLFGDGEDTASGDDGQHLAVDIPVSMNWYGGRRIRLTARQATPATIC